MSNKTTPDNPQYRSGYGFQQPEGFTSEGMSEEDKKIILAQMHNDRYDSRWDFFNEDQDVVTGLDEATKRKISDLEARIAKLEDNMTVWLNPAREIVAVRGSSNRSIGNGIMRQRDIGIEQSARKAILEVSVKLASKAAVASVPSGALSSCLVVEFNTRVSGGASKSGEISASINMYDGSSENYQVARAGGVVITDLSGNKFQYGISIKAYDAFGKERALKSWIIKDIEVNINLLAYVKAGGGE